MTVWKARPRKQKEVGSVHKRAEIPAKALVLLVLVVGLLGMGIMLAGTGIIDLQSGETRQTGLATGAYSRGITGLSTTEQVNQPPIYIGPPELIAYQDTLFVIDLAKLFTDPEGDALTFSIAEEDVISVSMQGSVATLTPEPGFVGERLLTIIASDEVNIARESVPLVVEAAEEPVQQESSGFGSQGFSTQATCGSCAACTTCMATPGNTCDLTGGIEATGTCITAGASNTVLNCTGFNITYGNDGALNDTWGVNITNHDNVTITSCNILKGNVTGTMIGTRNYGISIINSSLSLITNNNITTNGTGEDHGIFMSHGITSASQFLVSNPGNLNDPSCQNGTVQGVGTCKPCFTTAGVDCAVVGQSGCTDGEGFKTDTLVSFNLTSAPVRGSLTVIGGERVRCFINNLSNIVLDAFAKNNCGSVLRGSIPASAFTVGIENNLTCQVSGSGEEEDNGFKLSEFSYDIAIQAALTNITVSNNTIIASGGNNSHGVLMNGENTTLTGNNITTTGVRQGHAVFMDSSARLNNVTNNTITTIASGSDGIRIFGSLNQFLNNTILSATRNAIHVEKSPGMNNIFGSMALPTRPLFVEDVNGTINFTAPLFIENITNLSPIITISFNATRVNTSETGGSQLNSSARLTFFGFSAFDMVPVFSLADDGNFVACTACAGVDYNGSTGIISFNVTSFTTYAAKEISGCGVVDLEFNSSNGTVRLINDILNLNLSLDSCIRIVGDNITFDCDGFALSSLNRLGKGINTTNVKNVEVRDCTVENFSNNFFARYTNGSRFINNTARNSTDNSWDVRISSHNLFQNNTISTNSTSSNNEALLIQNSGVECTNNTVRNNSLLSRGSALIMGGGGTRCHNSVVINNTAQGSRFSNNFGILLQGDNATVIDNVAIGGAGILVGAVSSVNATVYRNNGSGAADPGIEIDFTPNSFIANNFGNSSSDIGIHLRDSANSTLIYNNGTSNSNIGIRLFSSPGSNLSENNGTSNSDFGIALIQHDSGAQFIQNDNVTMVNNTGVSNSSHGIRIEGTSQVTMIDNNGTSRSGNGIDMIGDENIGQSSTYIIDAYNGTWIEEIANEHFTDQDPPNFRYPTKTFGLPTGTTKVRIRHSGTDTAHMDAVSLDGAAPLRVFDTALNKALPIYKIMSADYDIIDVVERTIEVEWAQPGAVLTMTAIEEDVIILPDLWPRGKFAEYKIGESEQYHYYFIPGSSHPSEKVFMDFSTDGDTLNVALDFTPDNTYDVEGDWAQISINTTDGIKQFEIDNSQQQWGTATYGYTDKVSWQYKYYNFSIPLEEINAAEGDTIQFQLSYYGTGGINPPCQDNKLFNNWGFSVTGIGINIQACNNQTLVNNTGISDTSHGIFLSSSSNNTLIRNTGISNGSGIGIALVSSNNNTLLHNNASSNSSTCMSLSASDENFLGNNSVLCTNGDSFLLNDTAGINIFENHTFSSELSRALVISSSSINTFRNNTMNSTFSDAIVMSSSDQNNFSNNTITTSNGTAVRMTSSDSGSFVNNTIIGFGGGDGLRIVTSASNIFENNTVSLSGSTAVFLNDASGNTFFNNQLATNGGIIIHFQTSSANFSDGFEDGTLAPFATVGNAVWFINNTTPLSGSFSAQSGNIGNSQASALLLKLNYSDAGGTISYTRNVSSESGFDFLRFFIDGTQQEAISGTSDTTRVTFTVTGGGEHNFTWNYTKDTSASSGRDDALLDDINTIGQTSNTFNATILRTNGTWIFVDANSESNNFSNTLFEDDVDGSIRIPFNVTLTNTTNVSIVTLNIAANAAFLNSTDLTEFNTSGIITLNSITSTDPGPIADFDDDGTFEGCPTICTEESFANNVFVYNVTQFTTYSSNETAEEAAAPAAGGGGGWTTPSPGGVRRGRTQEAQVGPCFESWACEGWGQCIGGRQSRLCVDINNCGTIALKPETTKPCAITPAIEAPAITSSPLVLFRPSIPFVETAKPSLWPLVLAILGIIVLVTGIWQASIWTHKRHQESKKSAFLQTKTILKQFIPLLKPAPKPEYKPEPEPIPKKITPPPKPIILPKAIRIITPPTTIIKKPKVSMPKERFTPLKIPKNRNMFYKKMRDIDSALERVERKLRKKKHKR